MSLLRKSLLYLLLSALPVAVGGVWLFQKLIYRGIRYEIDEQLSSDLAFVTAQLKTAGTLVGRGQYLLDNPHVEEVQPGRRVGPVFSDTLAFDRRENEQVPVRRLAATTRVGNRTYLVVVKQAMGEFEEIAQLLSVSVIVAFLVLLSLLILLNGWVSRRLWQPFYRLIDDLRRYRLEARTADTFSGSDIDEFNQLSVALQDMSRTLHQQYAVQKAFTEHAAHEMQTPLAVVTTQLDRLLATEPLTAEQVNHLEQVQASIRRLAQLNKGLLLLTKIENNQFTDQQPVNLSALIDRVHRSLEPHAQHRGVGWVGEITPDVTRPMNPHLADVLFANLMKNTLLHAQPHTDAKVVLTHSSFTTINAGPQLPFPTEQLFDRFVKNPARPESTGLGLALVRQIAERYGLALTYHYDERARLHSFTLSLPT